MMMMVTYPSYRVVVRLNELMTAKFLEHCLTHSAVLEVFVNII
jgi:hypothetical protein